MLQCSRKEFVSKNTIKLTGTCQYNDSELTEKMVEKNIAKTVKERTWGIWEFCREEEDWPEMEKARKGTITTGTL